MDAHPFETVLITDSRDVLSEAIPTRTPSIFVGAPTLETLPDHRIVAWEDLLRTPRRPAGWFGELALTDIRPGTPMARQGGLLVVDKSAAIPGTASTRLVIAGRFFPRSDARSDKHQYTQRILRLKGNGDVRRPAHVLAALVEWSKQNGGLDLLTRVPPRAGHDDPLGSLIAEASSLSGVPSILDELVRVREYTPQKEIGDYENRRLNVRGAFRAQELPQRSRIALVDDIYTSGSTALECARELIVSGAAHVDLLIFGKNQHLVTSSRNAALRCADCGSVMRLRISSNEKAYWQCTNRGGCRTIQYYDVGLREANALNVRPGSPPADIAF
jgi:hypothetical protein